MLQHDMTNGRYFWHGTEITSERYAEIRAILDEMPTAPDGYYFSLTEDLVWELCEVPDDEDDPEPDPVDLLNILLGGAT